MAEKAPARAAWIQSERVETKCAGCSKQLRRICRTVCRRCQTPYCGPGCASRHESAHSLVCRKIAQGISDEVAAPWPPSAGAKVEYELNGRWFPGCISMASPTTLYFRYAARCLKNEEPIERDDLARLRPQRRLWRGSLLLHGWPAAVVELLVLLPRLCWRLFGNRKEELWVRPLSGVWKCPASKYLQSIWNFN